MKRFKIFGYPIIMIVLVITACSFHALPTRETSFFSSPLITHPNLWPEGKILYHSDLTGVYQIYLVNNGQAPVPLTKSPGSAVEPTWSPDGTKIAFAAYTTDPTNIEIYILELATGKKRKLMPDQPHLNWRPDWSPDGKYLLFQSNRDGNFEIYKASIDGTALINLTKHPANDGDPDWSPDGSKIVFISDRDGGDGIYVMGADGANVFQILDGSWDCSFPRWSPDGKKIAFASERDGTSDIYIVEMDSGKVSKVTNRFGDNTMPFWVGENKLIFSGEVGDRSWDLFIIEEDGNNLVQLTKTPESERYPVWSP
ncbi:MAG: hypothetical protein DRI61_16510 [Chloroflexi bacterium]|nr:MAG: hypothetical protein DRI61_16510 [Chloroflexota bacterium]